MEMEVGVEVVVEVGVEKEVARGTATTTRHQVLVFIPVLVLHQVHSLDHSLDSGTGTSSGSGSTTSQFRPPPVDTRRQYKGFSFIFATDAQHARETVYGDEIGDSIRYLKPVPQGQMIDHSRPATLPYFFTGFEWKDVDGKQRSVSFVQYKQWWRDFWLMRF